jgi:membrane protein YdbS with pleckstrin-like domain
MDAKIELPKSKTALSIRINLFSISYVVLALISIAILTVPFRLGDNNFYIGTLIIIVLAILMYLVSIWYLRTSWGKTGYSLTETAIIVQSGVGTHTEDVYRFDSVVSASIQQSFLGKKYGYGNIVLGVPHMQGDLILRDIDQPSSLLEKMHKKLANSTVNPNALLS